MEPTAEVLEATSFCWHRGLCKLTERIEDWMFTGHWNFPGGVVERVEAELGNDVAFEISEGGVEPRV